MQHTKLVRIQTHFSLSIFAVWILSCQWLLAQPVAGINQIVCFVLPLIHIQKHRMWQDVVGFHFFAIFQTWSAPRRDGSSWLTPEHTPATCSPHCCTSQQQSKYSYLHSISSIPAKRGSSLISKDNINLHISLQFQPSVRAIKLASTQVTFWTSAGLNGVYHWLFC